MPGTKLDSMDTPMSTSAAELIIGWQLLIRPGRYPSSLSAQQQYDVLAKSIDVLTNFTGTKPLGYTAPAWLTSKELIPQLQEFGILYDHSFMHHDVQPYYAPDPSHEWIETNHARAASHWMRPMTKIRPSKVVEIPANWHLVSAAEAKKNHGLTTG